MTILKYVLMCMLGLYGLVLGFLYFAQESFLFQPQKLDQEHQFSFENPHEEVNLTMADGALINVLHFKKNSARGLIVYYHGNAGNLNRWGKIVQYYVNLGYEVVIMDYRQYGKSQGEWSLKSFLSDAEAVYQYATTRYQRENIIVYGRSLGTGFASWVASKHNPDLLILESPYTSIAALGSYFYPLVPSHLLVKYNFNADQYIKSVKCPIRIFHGTNDLIVPHWFGKKLHSLHRNERDIKLITIDGGGHNDLTDFKVFRNEIELLLQ